MVNLEKYDGALTALGFVVGYACSQNAEYRADKRVQAVISSLQQYAQSSVGALCSSACKVWGFQIWFEPLRQ